MKKVVDLLNKQGIRDRFKVVIGGCPVSDDYARQIGADGYGEDGPGAVRLAKRVGGLE